MIKILDHGFVELVSNMGDDLTVVNAARVSHNKYREVFSEADEKLIRYLLVNRHTSPFEHVMFTFRVKCPIFVARQWMRHRTQSYNEISRRYTSEEIELYLPDVWRKQAVSNKQASDGVLELSEELKQDFFRLSAETIMLYHKLLDAGVAREQARIVLPHSLYTSFYTTVNLHNLFHFLSLRDHPHAQLEIRLYSQAIKDIIKTIVPVSYREWENLKNEN